MSVFRKRGQVRQLSPRLSIGSVMTIERIARQAKVRLRLSLFNASMRISSELRPKRRSDTTVSGFRGSNVDGWSSAAILWRNQASPPRKASVTNPTATALPAGLSFAGRVRPITVRLPLRCAMRSLLASNEAPHEPQKRFSGGLACLHRGHGA